MSKAPRHWQPLIKADHFVLRPEVVAMAMKHHNLTEEEARRCLALEDDMECWINDL